MTQYRLPDYVQCVGIAALCAIAAVHYVKPFIVREHVEIVNQFTDSRARVLYYGPTLTDTEPATVNYIHKLQAEAAAAKLETEARDATLADLRRYLLSPKFHTDTTVQVRDVLHRIEQGLQYHRESRGL